MSKTIFTVTARITGQGLDGGIPTDVQWYRGTDGMAAAAALVQAAARYEDDSTVPEAMRYRTLSVTMTYEEVPAEPGSEHETLCERHYNKPVSD